MGYVYCVLKLIVMAECFSPIRIERSEFKRLDDQYAMVPCGRCPNCLKRRSSNWGFRLQREAERSRTSLFVTLTYDTKFVPITSKGFMTLSKRDVQLFFKRLRKLHFYKYGKEWPIRYYCAGEYGSERRRPHYHIILFNADELDIAKAWCDPTTGLPIGNIDIGQVSGASIAYTVKYINKGPWKPMHQNDDRCPEFPLMSKRLGSNWLTESVVNSYRSNIEKSYILLEGGAKMGIPRYFKDKILPISLYPSNCAEQLVTSHPSILVHLDDNKFFRQLQSDIVQSKMPELDPSVKRYASREMEIINFKNHYSKRKDL